VIAWLQQGLHERQQIVPYLMPRQLSRVTCVES
jgi:hypothetical protein